MPLHPLVIHFPIAFLLSSALLDIAAWVVKRPRLHDAAFGLLVLGTLGAGAAVLTGDAAHDAVKHLPGIVEPLESHEKLGFFTLWTAVAASLLRLVARRENSRGAFFVVALLTALSLGLLVRTALYGGRLVYRHGAGVEPVMQANPRPGPASPSAR